MNLKSYMNHTFKILCFCLIVFFPLSAFPQQDSVETQDFEDIGEFADGIFERELESSNIPGGVFVFVKDGEIKFSNGYGFANIEEEIPVSPESTLFYIASVTKSFTATAIMQLVEQEKLNLHTDINSYLSRFLVDNEFQVPVTLENLLTHTSGFDDKNIGYVSTEYTDTQPLWKYLESNTPHIVREPGKYIAYSNHGYGLAGLIIEEVSGVSYAEFINSNIFRPLGMNKSTASIPLRPGLTHDLAIGYDYDLFSEELISQPLGFRNIPPAGVISSTGMDMAKFLIAHLQRGEYNGNRIFSIKTSHDMHRQQFTQDPNLPGFAYGFYERHYGELRILQHAGGYIGYSALLFMIPEENLGFFIAVNRNTSRLSVKFVEEFLKKYFTVEKSAVLAISSPEELRNNAERFTGSYHTTRYSRRSVEKIAVWDNPLEVTFNNVGNLILKPKFGEESYWLQVDSLIFRNIDNGESLAFEQDREKEITYMFKGGAGIYPPTTFEKLSWKNDPVVQKIILISISGILASSFLVWPFVVLTMFIIRKIRKVNRETKTLPLASFLCGLTGMIGIVVIVGIDTFIGNSQYRLKLVYGMTSEMIVLLSIPPVICVFILLLAAFSIKSWKEKYWSLTGRIYYTAIVLTLICFIAFLYNWNFIGFLY